MKLESFLFVSSKCNFYPFFMKTISFLLLILLLVPVLGMAQSLERSSGGASSPSNPVAASPGVQQFVGQLQQVLRASSPQALESILVSDSEVVQVFKAAYPNLTPDRQMALNQEFQQYRDALTAELASLRNASVELEIERIKDQQGDGSLRGYHLNLVAKADGNNTAKIKLVLVTVDQQLKALMLIQ
jgi:uncharacterized protein with von Willebrand factor type A (vWA) domain